MPNVRQLLCAALATGLLLEPGSAEARFGKRSSKSSSSSRSSGSKVHDASPVGSSDDDDDSSSGSSGSGGSSGYSDASVSNTIDTVSTLLDVLLFVADTAERVRAHETSTYGSVPVTAPDDGHTPMYPYSYRPPEVEQRQSEPQGGNRNPVLFRLGFEGQSLGDVEGSAVGLNVGIEGKVVGVNGSALSLTLPTDDGTQGEDEIDLYAAHLTLAMYSSERGRLRGELGVAAAKAPDISFVGPSLGMSFEHCLFGAVDAEARAQLVPLPYLQLDSQAGLALHLGVVTVRGGWRFLMLDDRGHVDGEAHRDTFSGPYAGLGLSI
ncbi:hypothetical protein JQX13_09545 [Archangium violaceum]|uniref:hypothetical protein n=1 Tax=Archangium violaceum TaxID=83451 RepID=UPI00193BBB5D|nr:hypothetical protein [Archangium violaceum]QRK10307.1 hypothetical protein JQX13_09545 [Archangium violaceum]